VFLVLEGILLGLSLAVLLGPIFVALTQTGVQKGIRAGMWVGAGIWVSDVIVVLSSWYFVVEVNEFIQNETYKGWFGLTGGLILAGTGLITFFQEHTHDLETAEFSSKHSLGYFIKGFAVNFINPFTFIFWTGVASHYAGVRQLASSELVFLFSSVMCTIIVTDSLKVILSGWIRHKLTLRHLVLLGKVAGSLLVLFGIILIGRSGYWFTDLL
jgi:threonine/homoserine/homoserine lactone efflux protein